MSTHKTGGRTLGAVAVVAALVLAHAVAVASFLGTPERVQRAHEVASWAGVALAFFGTLAATRAFAPGDYLRRAWGLRTLASVLLIGAVALRSYWAHLGPGTSFEDSPLVPLDALVVAAANLSLIASLVLLVRTFKRSGLEPPRSWHTHALWALTALGVFVLSGPYLRSSVGQLIVESGSTWWFALADTAATLGDVATLLLVVPLLRVAYLLRGGRLARVWWTMAASGGVYLLFELRVPLASLLPGRSEHTLEFALVMRTLALGFIGLSGWMQREALAPQARPSPQPALHLSGAA